MCDILKAGAGFIVSRGYRSDMKEFQSSNFPFSLLKPLLTGVHVCVAPGECTLADTGCSGSLGLYRCLIRKLATPTPDCDSELQ